MQNYYRKAWHVSAYTFNAELLCPDCTIQALPTGEGEAYESSYDSDEFPKVVFSSDLEAGETCGKCGTELW